jgi:hypothetical protein
MTVLSMHAEPPVRQGDCSNDVKGGSNHRRPFPNDAERLVAVERNGAIVPKSAFGSTLLEEGDVVEIAHFVGGG